jgi:methyltransferase (TIGR00027 family)
MSSSKASATGFIIASALVKLARLPKWRPYFTQDAIRLNESFVLHAADSTVKRCIRSLPPALAIRMMDLFFVPGLMQHYVLRKNYIEERVRHGLSGEIKQVVNLGAGFDTLMLRLAKEFPDTQFFEIDLPNTQEVKTNVLQRTAYSVPSNCTFIPVDLSQTKLEGVLSATKGFDPAAPTCVILEGVLMYLLESEVRSLFLSLRGLFRSELRVIFGATVISTAKGNSSMRAINYLLGRGNEAAKWSCPSAAMPAFMTECGYTIQEWVAYKKLQATVRSVEEIRNVPEENENYYVVRKA